MYGWLIPLLYLPGVNLCFLYDSFCLLDDPLGFLLGWMSFSFLSYFYFGFSSSILPLLNLIFITWIDFHFSQLYFVLEVLSSLSIAVNILWNSLADRSSRLCLPGLIENNCFWTTFEPRVLKVVTDTLFTFLPGSYAFLRTSNLDKGKSICLSSVLNSLSSKDRMIMKDKDHLGKQVELANSQRSSFSFVGINMSFQIQ